MRRLSHQASILVGKFEMKFGFFFGYSTNFQTHSLRILLKRRLSLTLVRYFGGDRTHCSVSFKAVRTFTDLNNNDKKGGPGRPHCCTFPLALHVPVCHCQCAGGLSESVCFCKDYANWIHCTSGGGRKARRNFIKTEKLSIKRSEQRIRPLYRPALPTVLKYILNGNPPVTT